ncbi:MAG: hypothetical protein ACOX6P_11690, partial [Candidatus Merdivicinus sp.]
SSRIVGVVFGDGKCRVESSVCAGAAEYVLEYSADYCESWQEGIRSSEPVMEWNGLTNGQKYFVRVRAVNAEGKSGLESHEYPVYPTAECPAYPEGMAVSVGKDTVEISWGEVLGACSYRLYVKAADGSVSCVYEGSDCHTSIARTAEIHQFAVSASNANGEGSCSPFERDDDPDTLENYDPMPGLEFSRDSQYCHHAFSPALPHKFKSVPPEYPQSYR